MTKLASTFAAFAATLAITLAAATPAVAQSVEERVDLLLGDAYADYDMLQLDAAEDKLFQAIDLVEEYGISTPGAAGAYIMLGVVWAARSGDSWQAFDAFVDGLTIDPYAEVHPYYATPSLMEVFEEARYAVPEEPEWIEPEPEPAPTPVPAPLPTPTPTPAPTPQLPPPGQVLMHTPVSEASGGRPVRIDVRVSTVAPVAHVSVNYRPFGVREFASVALNPVGDGITWSGDIPGTVTRGSISVDYYVVATDRSNAVLGTAGTSMSPYTVFVVGGGDGPEGGSRSRSRSTSSRSRQQGSGEVFHLSLGAGSGLGLATAPPNVYAKDVDLNPGLAPTPLFLGLEAGFAPGRRSLHIVPFLRMQLVFLDSGVELEPLGGVKVRYFFDDQGAFRVYGQGGAGIGYVSHLVLLEEVDTGTYDTTNEGPIHVGGGVGFNYMITDAFGLQLDTYLMAMFTEFSLQLDATLSAYIAF